MSWQVRRDGDRRHVFLVLPSYTGHIWLPTALSLIHNLWRLREIEGLRIEFYPIMFGAQIWMVRSQAMMHFLASGASDMIMCDWDMMFEAPTLKRLLDYPVDMVGCDYPRRTEPIGYSTRFIRNPDRSFNFKRNELGLIEVEAIPTGLIRIARNAVERMVESYPELHYIDDTLPNKKGCALFADLFDNGRLFGEDISFCRRFRKIGGKVFVDPGVAVGHWGQKQFVGSYDHWMAEVARADPDDIRFVD